MAQQVQFVSLTQEEYNNLENKQSNRLYFTSDTRKIYKGDTTYAEPLDEIEASVATLTANTSGITADEITRTDGSFDYLVVNSQFTLNGIFQGSVFTADTMYANNILVDGKNVSTEGHTHYWNEVIGTSYINETLSTISENVANITPTDITRDTATFGTLTVTSDITFNGDLIVDDISAATLNASAITVDGQAVAVTGHTHKMADITDFDIASYTANIDDSLTGITESTIAKDSATFQDLTVNNSLTINGTWEGANLVVESMTAQTISLDGKSVSVEGHTHVMSEITDLSATLSALTDMSELIASVSSLNGSVVSINSSIASLESSISTLQTNVGDITTTDISRTNGSFDNLTVNTTYSLNGIGSAESITAETVNVATLTVDGKAVSISGHTHVMSEITDIDLSSIKDSVSTITANTSGINSSEITRTTGSFNSLDAESITVNGSAVSVEGHTHVMSEITDLSATLSALTDMSEIIASVSTLTANTSGITADEITRTDGSFDYLVVNSQITINGILQASVIQVSSFQADSLTVDGKSVSFDGHTHLASEITDIDISGIASSVSTISANVVNITASDITRTSGSFETLTVTSAFTLDGDLNVDNLNAAEIAVDSLTVDGSAVSLSGHTHVMSEITDLDLSGITASYDDSALVASISTLNASISTITASVVNIDASTITRTNGSFTNLSATNLYVTGDISFDTLTVDDISASTITVGGSSVSVDGHKHVAADITDLDISDISTSISSIDASITTLNSSITSLNASVSSIDASISSIDASISSIDASITTIDASISSIDASISSINGSISGITEDAITKSSATFETLTVNSTFTVNGTWEGTNLVIESMTAQTITMDGNTVSVEGHTHVMSEITDLSTALSALNDVSELAASVSTNASAITALTTSVSTIDANVANITASTISRTTGTYDTLTVNNQLTLNGDCTMSQVTAETISIAGATIDGYSVATTSQVHGNVFQKLAIIESFGGVLPLEEDRTYYTMTVSASTSIDSISVPTAYDAADNVATFELELNVQNDGLSIAYPWTWVDDDAAPDFTASGCYTMAVRGRNRSGEWSWKANLQMTEEAF